MCVGFTPTPAGGSGGDGRWIVREESDDFDRLPPSSASPRLVASAAVSSGTPFAAASAAAETEESWEAAPMACTFSHSGLDGSGTGPERVWNLLAHPALPMQMVGHIMKHAFQSAAPRTSALLSLNAVPGSGSGSQQGKPLLQSLAGALQGKKKNKKSWLAQLQSGTAIYPCICISAGQHSDTSAAYLLWPTSGRVNHGSPEERASYFHGLQKDVLSEQDAASFPRPRGHQATTLLELMTVRAFHSKALRRHSLGTALGFRIRGGVLTSTPAIVVFVARKVHMQWLLDVQRLPSILEGPGGVWCDVDVLEFSHYTAPTSAPREPIHGELVEGLRGNDPYIGPGSQVASQETYGTLGAVVRSQTGLKQLGFLTNRHVAVDLDYPNQKMFHPLPPKLGPGVFLGAVERATSFVTDDLWYGIFAGMNPESFVRADGAFIPFAEALDLGNVTTTIKGVGEMGEVMDVDLQGSIDSVVGKPVLKVGRSSGLTRGVIMAYAVEYNDENGICFFTDFLIVGENKQSFDLEGDSGSLILAVPTEPSRKPRPIGIIWGGTANRGRLKLRYGHGPENWTSGVDLGRLLNLLQLDLVTSGTDADLEVEVVPQSQEYLGKKQPKSVVDHSLRPDTSARSFLTYPSREGETQADSSEFTPRGAEGRRVSREWEAEYRAPEGMGISLSGISHGEPDSGSRHDFRKNVQEDASLGLGLFDGREAKRRRSST